MTAGSRSARGGLGGVLSTFTFGLEIGGDGSGDGGHPAADDYGDGARHGMIVDGCYCECTVGTSRFTVADVTDEPSRVRYLSADCETGLLRSRLEAQASAAGLAAAWLSPEC